MNKPRYKYDAAAFALYRERLAEGYARSTARGILAGYLIAADIQRNKRQPSGYASRIATLDAKRKELANKQFGRFGSFAATLATDEALAQLAAHWRLYPMPPIAR